MFTDIVGYSAMMQESEELGRKLRKRHKEIFQACTQQNSGQIIQYFGDGTLSVFDSAVAAVECAVCMQQQLQSDPPVPVRIGIHLGDILYDETEVYGHGVNVAARIEPICKPGGIFISDKVYDEIKNHSALKTKPLGTFQFKNIAREVGLYAVHGHGIPHPNTNEIAFIKELAHKEHLATAAEKSEAIQKYLSQEKKGRSSKIYRWTTLLLFLALAMLGLSQWLIPLLSNQPVLAESELSIAVLPFANMSGDDENEYFSDGMTEDILTLLSRISGLAVTSRTSVMQYKNTEKDTRRIARELGVNHLLEGSVRRDGNQVRITAQLIDAINDTHLWAKTYDEELTSIFAVQSQVAEDIAKHLKKNLSIGHEGGIAKLGTENFEAYDLYLKGRQHYREYTHDDNDKAIKYFKTALEIDPTYSSALAGLGDAFAQKWKWTDKQSTYLDSSIAMSQKAISVDPKLSEAHKALGLALQYEGKIDSALMAYEVAIQLDPYNDMASNNIGMIHREKGNFREGARWMHRTFDLNKTVPASTMNLAEIYLELGDDETALKIIEQGLNAHPDHQDLQMIKGKILVRDKEYQEARKIARKIIEERPDSPKGHMFLGDVYLQEKDWKNAGEQYKEAITQLEADGEKNSERIQALYALAEYQQGNREWAQDQWLDLIKKIDQKKEKDRKMKAEDCLFKSGIYATMGMHERALECLEEAKKLDWLNYKDGVSHPAFEGLKSNPNFNQIIREVQHKSDSLKVSIESLLSQASR